MGSDSRIYHLRTSLLLKFVSIDNRCHEQGNAYDRKIHAESASQIGNWFWRNQGWKKRGGEEGGGDLARNNWSGCKFSISMGKPFLIWNYGLKLINNRYTGEIDHWPDLPWWHVIFFLSFPSLLCIFLLCSFLIFSRVFHSAVLTRFCNIIVWWLKRNILNILKKWKKFVEHYDITTILHKW